MESSLFLKLVYSFVSQLLLLGTVNYPWRKRMGVALQCWWADELLIGLLDNRK